MTKKHFRTAVVAAAAAGALLLTTNAGAAPSPQGCHGAATVGYHQSGGNTGEAIGGRGNSDGDPTNGQAHSEAGRGQTLQQFLASQCGVGSQK